MPSPKVEGPMWLVQGPRLIQWWCMRLGKSWENFFPGGKLSSNVRWRGPSEWKVKSFLKAEQTNIYRKSFEYNIWKRSVEWLDVFLRILSNFIKNFIEMFCLVYLWVAYNSFVSSLLCYSRKLPCLDSIIAIESKRDFDIHY